MSAKSRKGPRLRARWRALSGYFKFGLIATLIFIVAIAILSLGPNGEKGEPRWKTIWSSAPNEIGDTIAGVASALAFLWIIVTVMIQGNELKLQRRELAMTRAELRGQREASEKIARVQSLQLKAFESQSRVLKTQDRIQRERRASEQLESIIDRFCNDLRWERYLNEPWSLVPTSEQTSQNEYLIMVNFNFEETDTNERILRQLSRNVIAAEQDIISNLGSVKFLQKPSSPYLYLKTQEALLEIEILYVDLAPADLVRCKAFKFEDFIRALRSLLSMHEIWEPTQ